MITAESLIREGEGTGPMKNGRYFPYKCSAGKTTIGIGRNIDDVGISEYECHTMLAADIKNVENWLVRYPFWSSLTDNRKAALISMGFNIGPGRFAGFKNMIAALNKRDYVTAAKEGLDSTWRKQVGRRAEKLMRILELDHE